MTFIISHRCNIEGKNIKIENNLDSFNECLKKRYWIEIDIRLVNNQFYVSHDDDKDYYENYFENFLKNLEKEKESSILLNIKENNYESRLLNLLSNYNVLDQIYFFDMELVENKYREISDRLLNSEKKVKLVSRASDRSESIERAIASVDPYIWIDEFDSPWFNYLHSKKIIENKKNFFYVSPELHNPELDIQYIKQRWKEIINMNALGICTDYANTLNRCIQKNQFI